MARRIVTKDSDSDRPIDGSVRALLHTELHSLEQVQVLLYLRSSGHGAPTVAAIGDALGIPPREVVAALLHLQDSRLVEMVSGAGPAGFRFAPRTPAVSDTIERLAVDYGRAPIEIMNILSANAIERLRTKARRFFEEIFAPKRKKGD